jgi:hypothetical protein
MKIDEKDKKKCTQIYDEEDDRQLRTGQRTREGKETQDCRDLK